MFYCDRKFSQDPLADGTPGQEDEFAPLGAICGNKPQTKSLAGEMWKMCSRNSPFITIQWLVDYREWLINAIIYNQSWVIMINQLNIQRIKWNLINLTIDISYSI